MPGRPEVWPPAGIPEPYADIAREVNNWGRWGDDDERGTLNLIDDAARRRARASVRDGRAIALGLPLSAAEGIQAGFIPGRVNPTITVTALNDPLSGDPEWISSSEDKVELSMQCATHWDAIAHVSYAGCMYNGWPAAAVTEDGAARCGIDKVGALVSRGVLLDVARARAVEVLKPGHGITPGDLDAALSLAAVELEPGDVVLVRTGQMVHLHADRRDLVTYTWPAPGLTMASAAWFRSHDVAAVATDTLALEVFPSEHEAIYLPVHLLHLVEMGMTQGQNWVLDGLAADCAADGRYEFLLDATPLPFTGGLGSPLNPVAVK